MSRAFSLLYSILTTLYLILKNGFSQRKNRLRLRRHGIVHVLESLQLLSPLLLCQRVRHLACRHRHTPAGHPHLGRRQRPDDGHRGRPHQDPLGQIPPVSAVGGRSVLDLRHPAFHNTRLGLWRQTRVGLCHVHTHDDRLHRHQCALRCHARCDDRQLAGKDRVLVVPHVFRLRRLVHSPLRMGSPVQILLRRSSVCRLRAAGSLP